jgi:hypothetical protein
MPVQPLIAFCDTAKRMVDSRERYGIREGGKISNTTTNPCPEEGEKKSECPIIEISLVEFDADATMAFVDVLLIIYDHKEKGVIPGRNDGSSGISRKRRLNDEMDDNISNECRTALIREGKISEQHIVECLKLAHCLQCRVVLATLTSILELSIDSRNCMAIVTVPAARVAVAMEGASLVEVRSFPAKYAQDVDVTPPEEVIVVLFDRRPFPLGYDKSMGREQGYVK